MSNVAVSADSVVVGNGVISVLEALTVALLDQADSVLIPTPVFPGLVNAMSLRVRSLVELMDVGPDQEFRLTAAALESHLYQLRQEGKRVRAILLCSPGNPVGQVFSRSELREFLEVAELFECALIVDEIYAGSVYEGSTFVSAVSLKSPNVFVLGGLSKDFGLAGYAVGWLHSTNQNVIRAVAKQSHFFRLPAPTQRDVAAILEPTWRNGHLQRNRLALTETARTTVQTLQKAGIPVVSSESGLCLWLDLRSFLKTNDRDGEMELYLRLLEQHRVHISPSVGFKTTAVGHFRLCFSQRSEVLHEGLDRLIQGLTQSTQPQSTQPQSMEEKLETALPAEEAEKRNQVFA
jgi:aspartate/methionine/tyrosine aminotransferase